MKQKITDLDIVIFFRQFATLTSAGVPIIRSCDLLLNSQTKILLREIIRQLKKELLSGKTLYASFKNYPKYFSELICYLIMISEHTGRLDNMLTIIATYLEKQLHFKKRIHQALFYPSLVCLIGLITTFAMLIFIVPKFADLFQDMQNKLPLVTRVIFFISKSLNDYLAWFIVLPLGVFFLIRWRLKNKTGKINSPLFHFKKLPIIRSCWQSIILTRFTRNLAMTLSAGVAITEALKISGQAVGDKAFTHKVLDLIFKMSSGLPLHQSMEKHFPVLLTQMVQIGEESGMLEHMLEKAADLYQSDADHLLSQLNQALEPLIMLGLGALIGGLVVSMYLPIFNLGSTF